MLRVANRVKESTLTSGSGTIALAGASNGYQSFSSVLSNGDTSYYTIVNGDIWEVGIGTYSSNTLSRDVVLSSSNSNNKLDLNGQSYVFIAYPSEKSVYKDQSDQVVVGSSGIIIGPGNPFITSNVLYNSGGILYFNGLPVSNSVSITGVSGIGVSQSGNSYTISATGSFGLTFGQIQQLLNSGVSINVLSGTGNFNVLSVTGTPVSLSGHVHSTSDIINFNTEVSGLIPVKDILSGSGIQIGVNSGVYTVTAYGVAASSASSLITRCENRTGATLPKMTVVYINGGQGNRPTIQKSIASSEGGSSKTYGITASQINDGSDGDVVVFGALIDVDTNQFGAVEGSTLYLSPSVSGNLTATKPTAPNHMVAVGKIVRNHNNQGIIEVSIQNGFELEELHNVATTGAASGQFLKYDGGLWRNTGILSSDISDFSSAVSGLVPSISGSGYARVLLSNNIYTVSVTGLQPSGNYSTSGHEHTSSDITNFNSSVSGLLTPYALLNSGNFTTLFVTNVPVSLSGHLHTSSQITDFNSAVSGFLPFTGILGSGYVTLNSSNRILTIGVSGLQPSGNYSVSGHTHTSSNITDFTSNVSGILSSGVNIKLLNGSGTLHSLTVTNTGTLGTLQIDKFYHNNLAIASGFSDTDMLIAILTPTGTATTQMLQGSTLRSSLLNQPASLRVRQGTESERLLIIPATGEPIWVTDTKKFYIGDGTTIGGIFMSPVSVTGSGNVIVNTVSGVSTVFVSGLSTSGHTHISSNITDFNSTVSGLIPVKNILAGTNIGISNTSGIFTISVTGISVSGGGVSGSGYSPFTTGTLDTAILPTITSSNVNNELHSTIINGYNNSISNVGAAGTFDQCSIINGNNNQIYNNQGGNVRYCTIDNGEANEIRDSIKCTILNGDGNVVNFGSSKCLIGVGDSIFIDLATNYSTVLNGSSHILVSSARSTILNGYGNNIGQVEYGSIVNGDSNSIIGNHCTILGGINNSANGNHSVVLGGIGVSSSNNAELVFGGSTDFGQKSTFVLYRLTTDSATATQLVLDGSLNQISMPVKTTWNFNIQLSAYNYTDHTGAGFNFRGVARNNSVGSSTLLGNTIVEKWTEGSMSGVLASVSVGSNFGVVVNGLSGKNIRWTATVELSQVQGP